MIVKELLDKTFYNNVEIKYFNNSHLKAVVMNIPLLVTDNNGNAGPSSVPFAAFVVWAHGEVNNFASMFSRHVFTTQSSLTTVAECVSRADHHCQQVQRHTLGSWTLLSWSSNFCANGELRKGKLWH